MSKVEDILASTKVGDVLDAAKLNKFLKRQEEEEKKPSKFVEEDDEPAAESKDASADKTED